MGERDHAMSGSVSTLVPLPYLKMLSESASTMAELAAGRGNKAYRLGSRAVSSLLVSERLDSFKACD